MMELVSETDEQTMVLGEATVRTRCLAMFATPMRERAAKNKVELKVKLRIQHDGGYFVIVYASLDFRGFQILCLSSYPSTIRLSAIKILMKKNKLASLAC